MTRKNVVVLLGPPASGKGSISSLATKRYRVPVISPGEIYRKLRQEDSERGKLVRDSLADGGYCPSWLTNEIMSEATTEAIPEGGVVIHDGYPRTQEQLDFLNNNFNVLGYLYLTAPLDRLRRASEARRTCTGCGITFSAENPPLPKMFPVPCRNLCMNNWENRKKICALFGEEAWGVRWDDREDFYDKRYHTYITETLPILEQIRGDSRFAQFMILGESQEVTESCLEWFGNVTGITETR